MLVLCFMCFFQKEYNSELGSLMILIGFTHTEAVIFLMRFL